MSRIFVISLSILAWGTVGCSPDRASPQTLVDSISKAVPEQFELRFDRSGATPKVRVEVQLKPAGSAEKIATPLGSSIWGSLQSCPGIKERLAGASAPVTVSFSLVDGQVFANHAQQSDPLSEPAVQCLLRSLKETDFPRLSLPVVAFFRISPLPALPAHKS